MGFFRRYHIAAVLAALFSFPSTRVAFAQIDTSLAYDVTHLAGGPGGPGATDGLGLQARFNAPSGIWGQSGNLYIADSGGRSLRKIAIATGDVSTIARLDNVGCTSTNPRDRNPVLTLWADAANAYLGDSCVHVVYKIALDSGNPVVLAGQFQKFGSAEGSGAQALFSSPNVMWGDDAGLYVRDGSRVVRIDKQTGDVTLAFTDTANIIDIDPTYLYTVRNVTGGTLLQSVKISTGEAKSIATLPSTQSLFGLNPVLRRTEGGEDFLYMLTFENTIRRIRVTRENSRLSPAESERNRAQLGAGKMDRAPRQSSTVLSRCGRTTNFCTLSSSITIPCERSGSRLPKSVH